MYVTWYCGIIFLLALGIFLTACCEGTQLVVIVTYPGT